MNHFLRILCVLALSLGLEARSLEIYWVDVEGGGATLVVTPAGESILIDAGEDVDRDASRIFDVASRHAGLKQIDHVVITHWHSDHVGGVSRLSRLIPLKHFYDHGALAGNLPEDPGAARLYAAYRDVSHGHSTTLKPGDTLPLKEASGAPPVVVECLAANRMVADSAHAVSGDNQVCRAKQPVRRDETDNSNSLVLKLTYGKFSFFDGGDLTRDIEERLVCPVNRAGRVDLYQTDHHGLDLSNNPVLIRSIRPRVVVVNNGPQKGAEAETMKTLLAAPGIEAVWQLHRNVRSADASNTAPEFTANSAATDTARFIKATIQPDGAFSLQIGDSGPRKDYRPR